MPLRGISGKSKFHKQHLHCKEYNKKTHAVPYYPLVPFIFKKCFGSKACQVNNGTIGYKTAKHLNTTQLNILQ